MYIILPNASTRRKVKDLQKLLTHDKINRMISKMEYKTALIAFPKFHVTSTLNLKRPLIKMGISDIFVNGQSDLSLISDAGRYLQQAAAPAVSHLQGPIFSRNSPAITRNSNPTRLHQQSFQAAPSTRQLQDPTTRRILDRYNEPALLLLRLGDENDMSERPAQIYSNRTYGPGTERRRSRRSVTYKVESEYMRKNLPLRLKDLILSKRITKLNPGKKLVRSRRQARPESAASLKRLDDIRTAGGLRKPQLYVDDILHKVDFEVNEQGTEAAAATITVLRKSGTQVAVRCERPFLILVRHDLTKLPLFYGKVNIPR